MGTNPWPFIGIAVLIATVVIIVLAWIISMVMLALSNKSAVKVVNKHIRNITKLLPGKDCGACGCENCECYAEAVLYRDVRTPCPHCDAQTLAQLDACADTFWELTKDPTPPKKRRSWFNTTLNRMDN